MKFNENVRENPLSSKKFWRRIDIIKNGGNEKNNYFPVMLHNNKEFKTDLEKANMFGNILNETFKDNEDEKYDQNFKNKINKEINEYLSDKSESNFVINEEIINGEILNKILKNLKTTLSSGED